MSVRDDLVKALSDVGIEHGDLLYVASDITLPLSEAIKARKVNSAAQRNEFLADIVETLQFAVGDKGTLMFPVFTWGFCRGEVFNISKTPCEVGAFNNWIMTNRLEFKRTKHPIYSFMVWGDKADNLLSMENKSSWGVDSPFAYLHEHSGKMLLLSVSVGRGITFMHYVEEKIHVPYRYMKDFAGLYVDYDGNQEKRSYSMFVRDLSIKSQRYVPDEWFDKAGITKVACWGNAILRSVDLPASYELIKNDLLFNKGRLTYMFDNYEIDWQGGPTHPSESHIF